MKHRNKRIIVLDTSAFIAGFDPFLVEDKQFSVPIVEQELIRNSLPWVRFKNAVDRKKIELKDPSKSFLKKVKDSSKSVGDLSFLSETDLKVLALALEQKSKGYNTIIASDDYSIQNVASQIDVAFTSLTTFGIRFRLLWVIYCPACYRKYPPDTKSRSCEICGTKLKRKAIGKKSL